MASAAVAVASEASPIAPSPSAATPHKRIVAPSFDDDDSDDGDGMDLGEDNFVRRRNVGGEERRLKSLLFEAGGREGEDEGGLKGIGGREFGWRFIGEQDEVEVERPRILGGRRAIVGRRKLPEVGVRASVAGRGVGEWRGKGWRGYLGAGTVGVCGRGRKVVEVVTGRVFGREKEAMVLRVHATAWRGGERRGGEYERSTPGFGRLFEEVIFVDRVVKEVWGAVEGHGKVVLGLLRALYDSGGEGGGEGGCLLRRVVLWACGEAGEFVGEERFGSGALGRCLKKLCGGDIPGAVKEAVGAGYLRLGMMVARAAESDKAALRGDAGDWLESCGGLGGEELEKEVGEGGGLSAEERMILAVLSGDVREVAIRLDLSWYRLFAMELLHGAGSSAELMHSQRISNAVAALESASRAIPPRPPHGQGSTERDAAYHLLRLYADPTASYPLTAGVYSSSSFGVRHDPCDARMPWLLHQTLSALVPRAVLSGAVHLSNAYAAQLEAAGMPLWSFYVLCSGGPPAAIAKEALLRLWPRMYADRIELDRDTVLGKEEHERSRALERLFEHDSVDDGMIEEDQDSGDISAVVFLVFGMKVPICWVHEAHALYCRSEEGMEESECEHWLQAGTAVGLDSAQRLVADVLFPRAIAQYDSKALTRLYNLLQVFDAISRRPVNWSTSGGLILDFLRHVYPETKTSSSASLHVFYATLMPVFRSMTQRVRARMESTKTPVQRQSVTAIADGIVAVQRVAALFNPSLVCDAFEDLQTLQDFVSLATARRVSEEYKEQTMDGGLAAASLFVSALPLYASYIGRNGRGSVAHFRETMSLES